MIKLHIYIHACMCVCLYIYSFEVCHWVWLEYKVSFLGQYVFQKSKGGWGKKKRKSGSILLAWFFFFFLLIEGNTFELLFILRFYCMSNHKLGMCKYLKILESNWSKFSSAKILSLNSLSDLVSCWNVPGMFRWFSCAYLFLNSLCDLLEVVI